MSSLCRALNALQSQLHTTMTPDSWIAFCMRHPYLLYPVILVQNELRTALLGVSFWEGNTTYRSDICDQQYLPFGKFLNDLLAGKLDPCYEKRRMRNKSATIIMKPTQSPYFSNRRGIHSIDEQPSEPSASDAPPPLPASRSKTPNAGTALTTPTPLSEMTSGRDPSSERKLFNFDSHRFSFSVLVTHSLHFVASAHFSPGDLHGSHLALFNLCLLPRLMNLKRLICLLWSASHQTLFESDADKN